MMTTTKCREVLARYEAVLAEMDGTDIAHLRTMIPKMRVMLDEADDADRDFQKPNIDAEATIARYEATREKFMRWLGFLQGAFFVMERYTIDEMRQHNAPE